MPDVCLSFVLFTIFIIVFTQKLVLQQSKNVTAKCTENLSPPPCILYLLGSGFKNIRTGLVQLSSGYINIQRFGSAQLRVYKYTQRFGSAQGM